MTKRIAINILTVMWIVFSVIIFARAAFSAECTGKLPVIGMELDMSETNGLRVMISFFGSPSNEVKGVYTWNLDKASKVSATFVDGKLKAYEGTVTEKNTRKSFASFYNLFRLRVMEAYNNGYRIEFQLPFVVCYACEDKHLYFIEVVSDDGDLTFKRRWTKK